MAFFLIKLLLEKGYAVYTTVRDPGLLGLCLMPSVLMLACMILVNIM